MTHNEKEDVGFRQFDDSQGGIFAQNMESSSNIPVDNHHDLRTSQSVTLSETQTAKAYITDIISFKRRNLFDLPSEAQPKDSTKLAQEPVTSKLSQTIQKLPNQKMISPVDLNGNQHQPNFGINIQSINHVSIPPPKMVLNLTKTKFIKRYTNRTLNLQATACERLSKISPSKPTHKQSESPNSKDAHQFPPIKPFSPQQTIRHVRKIYSRSNNHSVVSQRTNNTTSINPTKSTQRTDNSVQVTNRLFDYTSKGKRMQQADQGVSSRNASMNRTFHHFSNNPSRGKLVGSNRRYRAKCTEQFILSRF